MTLTIAGSDASWISELNSGTLYHDLKDAKADGTVSFAEMKALVLDALAKVEAADGVTQEMFDDLTLIATNLGNGVYTSSYVASIFQQMVLGADIKRTINGSVISSGANLVWNGGTTDETTEYNLDTSGGGASAENFKLLVDEWFNGLDRPDGTGDDGTLSTYEAMTTATLWDNAAGDVSTSDVHQGNDGFCAVLSSLNALVTQNPDILKQIIVDNGDDTYGVRFFSGGDELWVTVDNQLPIYTETYSDGTPVMKDGVEVTSLTMNNSGKDFSSPLWASLIEKAFAQASSTGFFDHAGKINSYANAGGNYPGYILYDFTNTSYFDVKYSDTRWNAEKALVIAALAAGDDVELTSNMKTYDDDDIKLFESNHAFTVLSYDSVTDKFTVRNPWGDAGDNPRYHAEFDVTWSDIKADRATLTIDNAASLESPFRIEATGSIAVTGEGVTIASLVNITDLDGKDVDYVRLKVVGDGAIDLNGATDHADDAEAADGYVVVSARRLSTVTYTAGASSSDYLVIGAINEDTYGPVEFFKISSSAETIQITPHRTRVLGEGETIGVASLTDVSGVHDADDTWYQAKVKKGGGGFAFSTTPSDSTDQSASNPYAYGADYQSLTYTAPQAYGQITLRVQITDDLQHESAFVDFAVWVGNTAAVAIQNFNNGTLSKAQAVADTSANVIANLDALAEMVNAKTLKYIGFTDDAGGRPTVHLTGAQIARDYAALAVMTDALHVVVDGGIDAATQVLGDQLTAIGSLDFVAGAPVGPVLSATPTVAAYLADVAAYDAKADGFTVTDTAAAILAAKDQFAAHPAAKLAVVDGAAAIVAGIDALAKMAIVSVAVSDGSVLDVASSSRVRAIVKADAALLAVFEGGVSFRVTTVNADASTTRSIYGADGKIAEQIRTGITGQSYTSSDTLYDSNGKVSSATYSDGRVATYARAADGSYVVHWSGISGQSYTSYDAAYGADGKQTSATYPDGRVATWARAADGSYVVHWSGISGQSYTSYDAVYGADGKQTSATYSDGRVATYLRNAEGSYVVHWTGIAGQSYTSYDAAYGADGKQTSATYSDGRLAAWTRNADGSYVVHWSGISGKSYTSYDAAYGADGKQTSATYSDGRVATYGRAADGSYEIETRNIVSPSWDTSQVFYGVNGKALSEVYSKAGVAVRVVNRTTDGTVVETTSLNGSSTSTSPFGGRSSIDLRAFDPTSTTLGFAEDASNGFGVLTLTKGNEQLALTLFGQYTASSFAMTADGHGGLLLARQSESPLLVG